jgi:GDP-4-dehydro-6-deoxy-D-mannose reductase
VLLVGSADCYGPAEPGESPFSEARPLRPGSAYARTKAAADALGAAFAARGLSVVRARPFNHTGPGQGDGFVLSSFARQAVEIAAGRRPPVLWVGNLDSARDFLDVEDVVRAYLLLADPRLPPGAYNIASGRGVRIGDALAAILRHAGAAPEIRVEPGRFRPTDRAVGDAARLRAISGWEPRIPLDQTLARLVADWRARISAP